MIAIKDMKMPKNCVECDFSYVSCLERDKLICSYQNCCVSRGTKRDEFCPLIEVEVK